MARTVIRYSPIALVSILLLVVIGIWVGDAVNRAHARPAIAPIVRPSPPVI